MMKQIFDDKHKLPDLGVCPICGSDLKRMWGNGFDYDHAFVPAVDAITILS